MLVLSHPSWSCTLKNRPFRSDTGVILRYLSGLPTSLPLRPEDEELRTVRLRAWRKMPDPERAEPDSAKQLLKRLRPETEPEMPHPLGKAGPPVFPYFHDQHPPAGFKHTVHFRENRLQIHDVVKDQRHDRQIERPGLDGQCGKVPLDHLRGRLVP